MSQNWTDYAENKFVDFTRGSAFPAVVSWYIGLLSSASDSAYVEVTGANLARKNIARSMAAWSGTQGEGTTTASSGTSHRSSNNASIDFAAASADLAAPAAYVGLFDASSGGNLWAHIPMPGGPLTVHSADTPSIAASQLILVVGEGSGCSDYLANKLIDLWLRGQAFSWPATTYEALMTTMPANAGGGVEVSAPSYARVGIASDTTHWSATQSPTSGAASTGTTGKTVNRLAINFAAPLTAWGTLEGCAYYDASAAGNLLGFGEFAAPRTISAGGAAPSYAAGQRARYFL